MAVRPALSLIERALVSFIQCALYRERGDPLQVLVRDNNIDQALRVLKKRLQREGVFREMKRRRSFEKPSEKRAREKSEAVRRARKLARKQAIRDGLIAAPPRKPKFPASRPSAPGQSPQSPQQAGGTREA